jgi:DNA polymerase V
MQNQNIYVAIDLKSFYASVECKERGLDPLTTNLVVADSSRTEKTICLAVSPSLKQYGIPGRARLFEVVQKVREINANRRYNAPGHVLNGKSYEDAELKKHLEYELDYIVAPPQMNLYMKYSTTIYNVYLKYFSPDDIYVYSIDEVFIDVTHYLQTYQMKASSLASKIIQEVYDTTGITATCGVGTNLYLAKVAMDIVAKHAKANKNGVRIACLDEMMYKRQLWNHKPLTDFWRVGKGIAKKLEQNNMHTMGDVARCSIHNEDKLFKLFGINAELLIDHAWGYEPCTMQSIKSYVPTTNSISSGQVLHCPYNYEKTKLIIKEMTELLVLDLVDKHLVTNQLVLTVGYDIDNLTNRNIDYKGEVTIDRYGRSVPKHAHGTENLDHKTSSNKIISEAVMKLYDRIIDKRLLTRRITLTANNVINEEQAEKENSIEQIDLFTDYNEKEQKHNKELKERNLQRSILDIKKKYGKNAILKGMNFEDGATTIERNEQVGGHKG